MHRQCVGLWVPVDHERVASIVNVGWSVGRLDDPGKDPGQPLPAGHNDDRCDVLSVSAGDG